VKLKRNENKKHTARVKYRVHLLKKQTKGKEQKAPLQRPNISPASSSLLINCEHPSREEITKAVKALRNGKAAGLDNIPPEAIKATEVDSTEMLYAVQSNMDN